MWPRFGGRKANCREKSEPDHMIRGGVQRSQGKKSLERLAENGVLNSDTFDKLERSKSVGYLPFI